MAAVFAAAILSMLPTMQFSGISQPVSTLGEGARLIGSMWSTTYYMHLSVGAITKGLSLRNLLPDVLMPTIFPPVFLGFAVMFLKKQEK
ncbi:hypothetical protein [Actibacterium sp. D379-3]